MVKKKANAAKKQTTPQTPTTFNDVKSAILVVSLLINLAVFIFWIILRVTTKYDEQVFNFIFTR